MSDRIGLNSIVAWPSASRRLRPDLQVLERREALHTDFYRLTRLHQRLDEQIRTEADRRFPDPLDLFRLRRLRQRVKTRLRRLGMAPSPA